MIVIVVGRSESVAVRRGAAGLGELSPVDEGRTGSERALVAHAAGSSTAGALRCFASPPGVIVRTPSPPKMDQMAPKSVLKTLVR